MSQVGFDGDLDPRVSSWGRGFSTVMSKSRKYPEELLERLGYLSLVALPDPYDVDPDGFQPSGT